MTLNIIWRPVRLYKMDSLKVLHFPPQVTANCLQSQRGNFVRLSLTQCQHACYRSLKKLWAELLRFYTLALTADRSPEYGECEVKFLANKFGMAFQHVKHAFREYRDSYGASTPSAMLGLLNCVNTIPVSTAECERGFSKMNVICSSLRSRLTVPHTSSLMFLTLCGPPVQLWQPLKYVKAWLAKSRRGADSSHGLQWANAVPAATAAVISMWNAVM